VKSVNATNRLVTPLFFTLHDADNNTHNIDLATNDSSVHGLPTAVLAKPGDTMNGVIVFQVPQNATLVAINYDDHFSKVTLNQ